MLACPADIVYSITTYLTPKDLQKWGLCNRHCYNMIFGGGTTCEQIWKYRFNKDLSVKRPPTVFKNDVVIPCNYYTAYREYRKGFFLWNAAVLGYEVCLFRNCPPMSSSWDYGAIINRCLSNGHYDIPDHFLFRCHIKDCDIVDLIRIHGEQMAIYLIDRVTDVCSYNKIVSGLLRRGYFSLIPQLWKLGATSYGKVEKYAVKYGNLETLQLLEHKHHLSISNVIDQAIEHRQIKIMHYAINHISSLESDNKIELIKYMLNGVIIAKVFDVIPSILDLIKDDSQRPNLTDIVHIPNLCLHPGMLELVLPYAQPDYSILLRNAAEAKNLPLCQRFIKAWEASTQK